MKINILIFLTFLLVFGGCNEKNRSKMEIQTTEKIKVHPIEHATMVLNWEGTVIYVDPVGGAAKFKDFRDPDLILITDVHGDHFNLETLQQLNTSKAKLIVPQAVANQMPEAFVPQIDVLQNGERKERYEITIEAIPMYNLREEALKFHTKGRGNGYVLEKNGKRLYISGDTEDIKEMRELKNIDMAFVCMNLPYTMTEMAAAEAVLDFKPKEVFPYHYRGSDGFSDIQKFKQLVEQKDTSITVNLLKWYE